MARIKQRADFSDVTIRGFINFAFHDYIGARTLLRNGLPTQGTILAITALEKLMKAMMLLNNQSIVVDGSGHAISTMATALRQLHPALLTQEDIDFINHIDDAYKLRYPDNIDQNFELFLPSLRILENLDRIFCKLIESPSIIAINPNGKMYDVYIKQKQASLLKQNVHFDASLQTTIASAKQKYAHYKLDASGFNEDYCWSDTIKHDDNW